MKHFGHKNEPQIILTNEERIDLLDKIKKTILLYPYVNILVKDIETNETLIKFGKNYNLIDRFNTFYNPKELFVSNCVRETLNAKEVLAILYLNKTGDQTDHFQFIYVNGRYLEKCILHKAMNYIFQHSLITQVSTENTNQEMLYGVFFLNIRISNEIFLVHYDFFKNTIILNPDHYIIKAIARKLIQILSDERLLSQDIVDDESLLESVFHKITN